MGATILSASRLASDVLQLRSTIRIGITGLARAGKTALLTSLAANLLAVSAGRPALPAVSDRLRGRRMHVSIAPAAASNIPRFEVASNIAALAADPPRWPTRTTAVSMLALDVDVPREGLLAPLGPQRRRLEFLDYPGEWLLDLPLLGQNFADWSEVTLRRLETLNSSQMARPFLGFVRGLPLGVKADEALTLTGHRLYTALLRRMRDEAGLAFLQPGRFRLALPRPGRSSFRYRGAARSRTSCRPASIRIWMPSGATLCRQCLATSMGSWFWPTCFRHCTRDRLVLPTHDQHLQPQPTHSVGTARGLIGWRPLHD